MYRAFGGRGIDLHVVCAVIIVLVTLITFALGNARPMEDRYSDGASPWRGAQEGEFGPHYDAPYTGQVHPPTASLPVTPRHS